MKKIVFCGGHHNSALLIAERFLKRGDAVYWLGHKYSMIGDKNVSAEYLEVTRQEIPFYEIKAGKWQPKYHFLQFLLRIPLGFIQSFIILLKLKPDLVFSSGGYLALPVSICANLLGIPVVTHEQTVICGRANKYIKKFAKKIFVSFPDTVKYFPVKKVIYSGLPLRKEIFDFKKEKLFNNNKRTIYITGGKQGSHLINQAFFKIAPEILSKFNIIHQCGLSTVHNDYKQALQIKEAMEKLGENYLVKEYFFTEEIGNIFYNADILISRSGAHVVYEILSLKKPVILIPIPWSSKNEQTKNAVMARNSGLAIILPQTEMENGKLYSTILEFDKNYESYKLRAGFDLIDDPAGIIIKEVDKLL